MIMTNLAGPALAVGAIMVAIYSGYETIDDITRPALIDGAGTVSDTVHAGEPTLVEWVITKRTDCPGVSSRVWFGDEGFQLTEKVQATSLPMAPAKEYKIQTLIPELAPEGDLFLRINGHFDCQGKKIPFSLGPVVMHVASKS